MGPERKSARFPQTCSEHGALRHARAVHRGSCLQVQNKCIGQVLAADSSDSLSSDILCAPSRSLTRVNKLSNWVLRLARGAKLRESPTRPSTSAVMCGAVEPRGELEADTWHVAMVLRDPGLEKSSLVETLVAKRPKSEKISAAGRREASERKGYHVVQVNYNVCKLLSPDRPDLSFVARISGTRDEESHDEGPRGTQTCWTVLEKATSWRYCD